MMIYTSLLINIVDLAWKNPAKVGFAFDRSLPGVQGGGIFNREDCFIVIEISFSSSLWKLFILYAFNFCFYYSTFSIEKSFHSLFGSEGPVLSPRGRWMRFSVLIFSINILFLKRIPHFSLKKMRRDQCLRYEIKN